MVTRFLLCVATVASTALATAQTFVPASPAPAARPAPGPPRAGVLHRHAAGFCAVPPSPEPLELRQPNGAVLEAVAVGGAFSSYLETADGHTILRDPSDGYYRLAVAGPEGHLLLTDAVAGATDATTARLRAALPRHARLSRERVRDRGRALLQDDLGGDDLGGKASARGSTRGVFPASGNRRALLLLVDFPDQPAQAGVADVSRMTNELGYGDNGSYGSLRDYYAAISYGALQLETDVVGWFTAPEPKATYGVQDFTDDEGEDIREFERAAGLVADLVDQAEASGLDFADYDGDGDGEVDVVMVIHSGPGAESTRDGADVWSHRWDLRATDRERVYDGKVIGSYIIQPETDRTSTPDQRLGSIGVLCHEFGHALGLPDLYDYDGSTPGLEYWCLMASGTYAGGGRQPVNMSAWCRHTLGWVDAETLDVSAGGTLGGLGASVTDARVGLVPTGVEGEYFLLENRQAADVDELIPATGLTIYHVDENVDPGDGGLNDDDYRRLVDLEQADGRYDLNDNPFAFADVGDPFPGLTAATTFDCASVPETSRNDGAATGISLTDIAVVDGLASVTYGACKAVCPVAGVAPVGAPVCLGATFSQGLRVILRYEVPAGTRVTVALGEVRTEATADGREALVALGNVPADAVYDELVVAVAGFPDCAYATSYLVDFEQVCGPSNDAACAAVDLTAAIDTRPVRIDLTGFTAEPGEVSPLLYPGGDQAEWIGSVSSGKQLNTTAWFSFVAPSSAGVRVYSRGSSNLRAALYDVDDCAALRDRSRALLVAADQVSGEFSPLDLARNFDLVAGRCLVPGRRYYLQVDSDPEDGVGLVTDLYLETLPTPCAVADPAALGTCVPGGPDYGGFGHSLWRHVGLDRYGGVVASVNTGLYYDGGFSTKLSYRTTEDPSHATGDHVPFLPLALELDVDVTETAALRMYLTDDEWRAYRDAEGLSDLRELSLYGFPEAWCYDLTLGTHFEYPPESVIERFDGEDHLLQFRLPPFGSESAILRLGRSSAVPLPVELVRFDGAADGGANVLSWTSATEVGLSHYRVSRSSTGAEDDFAALAEVTARADGGAGADYVLRDGAPAARTYYRLVGVDADGSEAIASTISVANPAAAAPVLYVEYEGARAEGVRFAGAPDGPAAVTIVDALGRRVHARDYPADEQQHYIALGGLGLPGGTYVVTVRRGGTTESVRVFR